MKTLIINALISKIKLMSRFVGSHFPIKNYYLFIYLQYKETSDYVRIQFTHYFQ